MNSFQVLVDGELVTIVFKSLTVGLKVAHALQSTPNLDINTEKVKKLQEIDSTNGEKAPEDEQLEQMRYARTITSYALQQPALVDVHLNKFDHRIFVPSAMTCRTILATQDQRQLKEMLQLQSNSIQQLVQSQMQGQPGPNFQQSVQPGQPPIISKPPIYPPQGLPTIPVLSMPITNGFVPPTQVKHPNVVPPTYTGGIPGMPNVPSFEVVKQKIQECHQQIQKTYEYMLVQLFSTKPAMLVEYARAMNLPHDSIQSRDQIMGIVQKMTEQLLQTHSLDAHMQQMRENDNIDQKTRSVLLDNMTQLKIYMNYFQLYQDHNMRERRVMTEQANIPNVPTGFTQIPPPLPSKPLPPQLSSGISVYNAPPVSSKRPPNPGIPNGIGANIPIPALPRVVYSQQFPRTLDARVFSSTEQGIHGVDAHRFVASPNVIQMMRDVMAQPDLQKSQHLAQNILNQIQPQQVSRLLNDSGALPQIAQFGTASISVNEFAEREATEIEKAEIQDDGVDGAAEPSNSIEHARDFRGILQRYLAVELPNGAGVREARSDLALKLVQVDKFYEKHERFIQQHVLYKFHESFSAYENLVLLTMALPSNVTCFNQIQTAAITVVQCEIFARLNKLVKEKTAPLGENGATVKIEDTRPIASTSTEAPTPAVVQEQPQSTTPTPPAPPMLPTASKADAPIPAKLAPFKEMEMCNSFKEQVIDLGKKILPFVKAQIVVPVMVIILGVGDEVHLDVNDGMRFFKQNINKIYQENSSVFHENMEKVFILAITIIESMFSAMSNHYVRTRPRPLMYRAQVYRGEDKAQPADPSLPTFAEFKDHYLEMVRLLRLGKYLEDAQNCYFLTDDEIHGVLGGHNYTEIDRVVELLAVDAATVAQHATEKKVSTGFGIERSETDSDDM